MAKSKHVLLLLGFAAAATIACQGMNQTALYGGPNMNPAQPYGVSSVVYNRGGFLYHSHSVPGQVGRNAKSEKTGTVCSTAILNLVAMGDSSLETAKANGGITKIASVQYDVTHIFILPVYFEHCTVVTGE